MPRRAAQRIRLSSSCEIMPVTVSGVFITSGQYIGNLLLRLARLLTQANAGPIMVS